MSKRKSRGIRCSRVKLDAALASSSINKKTQIALAEAVADAESLESVPKDLVNKMFRELPVDRQTIERVASVLGVAAHSLYLKEESELSSEGERGNERDSEKRTIAERRVEERKLENTALAAKESSFNLEAIFSYRRLLLIGLFAILIAGAVYYLLPKNEQQSCFSRMSISDFPVSDQVFRIVIARFSGDRSNQAQMRLATWLASEKQLNANTEVYSSCFENRFNASGTIREQIIEGHKQAALDLAQYKAHLVIWGERLDNRLTLRFTSNTSFDQSRKIALADKIINTNSLEFSFSLRLDDQESLNGDLQLVILNMLSPKNKRLAEAKAELINQYNYAGNWLKEAVASDSNLLQRISKQSDPNLYRLTVTQLCFRRRLLGDLEGSDSAYLLADEACRQALEVTDINDSPMQWSSIQGNLAALMTRRALHAKSTEERVSFLEDAKELYSKIEPVYSRQANPAEAATFYQNFSAVYIRLAEIPQQSNEKADIDTHSENMLKFLNKAQQLSAKSLALSRPQDNPLYYAQRLQNQCVLKYQLGHLQKKALIIESGIEDCSNALSTISVEEQPTEFAMILNNLAISYAILAEIKEAPEAFEQALSSFDRAQSIYKREMFPLNWGEVEINKAELKCKLAVLTGSREKIKESRASAEAALLTFIQKKVKPYQDYAEALIAKTKDCESLSIKECSCSS